MTRQLPLPLDAEPARNVYPDGPARVVRCRRSRRGSRPWLVVGLPATTRRWWGPYATKAEAEEDLAGWHRFQRKS